MTTKLPIERPLALLDVARTVNQCQSFMTAAAMAAGSGASKRASRLGLRLSNAELATVRNVRESGDLWQTAERQMDLMSELTDEWREDLGNAAQIFLMTCADLQYWSTRISSSWTDAWLPSAAE